MHILIGTAVFMGALLIDVVAGWYTISVTKRRPIQAALATILDYALVAGGVFQIIQRPIYLVPAVIGGALGTYLIVKYFPEAT